MSGNEILLEIYHLLLARFGSQNWWPANTAFEIIVGAILTQQSRWSNVEKSIRNLKKEGLLEPEALSRSSLERIESLVQPSGFYRQKAVRVRNLSRYLVEHYKGDLDKFLERNTVEIRNELLLLDGIGPETADSILLYAGEKPVFVVDAYTTRFCKRFGLTKEKRYEKIRAFFETKLPRDLNLYKELHALIVQLGKEYCGTWPFCQECPLSSKCAHDVDLEMRKTAMVRLGLTLLRLPLVIVSICV